MPCDLVTSLALLPDVCMTALVLHDYRRLLIMECSFCLHAGLGVCQVYMLDMLFAEPRTGA